MEVSDVYELAGRFMKESRPPSAWAGFQMYYRDHLFTLGIQSWTRDVVTPVYHEKRNSLNPEELKAFEKEMIDYYEGHVGDRDRLKVDAGKRDLYRPVPTTNLGLSLPGTCAPQSLRMVEQSLRIRFLVHLMLPEHSLINMKTWPVILLTLPTMCMNHAKLSDGQN